MPLLGVRGRTPGLAHHTIAFPRDYDAEFDDVFVHRRPVRDPTLYVSASSVTDPGEAPDGAENWFVLVNAPAGLDAAAWEGYDDHVLERLGGGGPGRRAGRVAVRATPHRRSTSSARPARSAARSTAPRRTAGSARCAAPARACAASRTLLRVGGTAHPGGGLPLVALSGALAARLVGPAR